VQCLAELAHVELRLEGEGALLGLNQRLALDSGVLVRRGNALELLRTQLVDLGPVEDALRDLEQGRVCL
jgi:hypothetical protein